ncbi:hypothetical protein B9Z55_028695 [Caenorhabditis nigoni]|uniref:Uncharacterized protein n=1 Tax=Caenorhabditis nigoni TaxID=1611254 RepID=A0A2G5SA99_9PELO|nr:hypothetical protein B9Z55_028695 [Caenorhabditis nigoni]
MFQTSQEDEDNLEVKFIDSAEFQDLHSTSIDAEIVFRWVESFDTEAEKWIQILSKFVNPLAGKEGFCFRINEKFAKFLQYQGAEAVQTEGVFSKTSNVAPRSLGDTANLPVLLKNFSETLRQVNLAQYIVTVLSKIGQEANHENIVKKTVSYQRLKLLHLYHNGYKQGIENLLSNHRLLRHFRHGCKTTRDVRTRHVKILFIERDAFTIAPEASTLALQTVLEDWNCQIQDEKIVQTTHANTLQMRSLHVGGDGFYFLNESLNCAMALNYNQAQEEMEEFDTIFTERATNPRGRQLFNFWKLISKYERHRKSGNPRGFMLTAQRLEEECTTEDIGAACTVLVETACKIRNQCGQQYDEIATVITDTIARCPSMGPRMLQLADHCKVGHEKEVLLQQMCDIESSNGCLHPSELLWLDCVDNFLMHVNRYGSVRHTMEKSLKIMFEFLDFDTNRFNERAWVLMEKVLEMSDPSFVVPQWKSRVDWWPKYQKSRAKDGRRMSREVSRKKRAVMEALEDIAL